MRGDNGRQMEGVEQGWPEVEDKWRGGEEEGGTWFWLAFFVFVQSANTFVFFAGYICSNCKFCFFTFQDIPVRLQIFCAHFRKHLS